MLLQTIEASFHNLVATTPRDVHFHQLAFDIYSDSSFFCSALAWGVRNGRTDSDLLHMTVGCMTLTV